ncbi:MAG: hypothetical protein ACK8QZ_08145, partial [Anaerolineales bacterium]
RMGVPSSFVKQLSSRVFKIIEGAWKDEPGVTVNVNDALKQATDTVIHSLSSQSMKVLVADVLFRMAEIAATKADNAEMWRQQQLQLGTAPQQRTEVAQQFAAACAIYRVADRVRSESGNDDAEAVDWPVAGARSLRYYVRACLKLSRLLLDGSSPPNQARAINFAEALLEHAQNRLSMYTRHHFRFQRERGAALLLESARIRTWVRVMSLLSARSLVADIVRGAAQSFVLRTIGLGLQRTRPKQAGDNNSYIKRLRLLDERARALEISVDETMNMLVSSLDNQWQVLEESAARLDEAEDLLLALGYQRSHVRRLLLERVKFATTGFDILAIGLDRDSFEQAAAAMAQSENAPTVESAACEKEVQRLFGDLQIRLKAVAQRRALARHLEVAKACADELTATAAGDLFWEQIAFRQQSSLGFVRKRSEKLVDAR